MYLRTTSNTFLFILFLVATLISCSKKEEILDPRDVFVGSYIGQEFCNENDTYKCSIKLGDNENTIIWVNSLGQDGTQDDVVGTISGINLFVSKQKIDGLEVEASGIILPNGTLDMFITIYAGPLAVHCDIDFLPN